MKFRPCIDIHNGKVKQIVGGSLQDAGNRAKENFVSEMSAADYADLYKKKHLRGGHVILLNQAGSEYYEAGLYNYENTEDRPKKPWLLIRMDCRSEAVLP